MSVSQESHPNQRSAFGVGLASTAEHDNSVLDVWYPSPTTSFSESDTAKFGDFVDGVAVVPPGLGGQMLGSAVTSRLGHDPRRDVTVKMVATHITSLDDPPANPFDAYLRLHLLSHRTVTPRSMNLDGLFGVLTNVVWTNFGPCAVDGFETTRLRLQADGPIHVYGVDKFPRMVDYVVPAGVRIADADRVRLGAHLAEGTTVMHEGFVNFNAGTLGASMVEGRISAGVVVGDGSDVGGGASIMGTLSGGGSEVISVGKRCLIGANAGVGISLGDDCVVEAGLYLTAGTKIRLPDDSVVPAREVSGHHNLRYWRNSITGAVEAVPRSGTWGGLNESLHAN